MPGKKKLNRTVELYEQQRVKGQQFLVVTVISSYWQLVSYSYGHVLNEHEFSPQYARLLYIYDVDAGEPPITDGKG
jgi:hypothetical protein